ncbi:unnamed protein product, partial [Protopolystoma xenopodis]
VGDIICIDKDQRVPADVVLLWTSDRQGTCFIRTDQLDGETDWKLRQAIPATQEVCGPHGNNMDALLDLCAHVYAEPPNQNIHSFEGTFTRTESSLFSRTECSAFVTSLTAAPQVSLTGINSGVPPADASLSLDNTAWSNTVLATGSCLGLVVYTGSETRAVMNSSKARTKLGRVDRDVNNINKLLFFVVVLLALVMIALKGFMGSWFKYYWRFFLLFSYIIPLA